MAAYTAAQAIPQGAKAAATSPLLGIFKGLGNSMIPIPSITGGAAGPATSGGIGEQGNIGAITFGNNYGRGANSPWVTIAIIGAVAFIGVKLWQRK